MLRVLAQNNIQLTSAQYEKNCLGQTDQAGFANLQAIFPELNRLSAAALVQAKVNQYQNLIKNKDIIYSGVKNTLNSLKDHFLLGLVTGSLRVEVEPILSQANLNQVFTAIISADDISHSKPDPEGYLKGIAALDLPASQIIAVEDTATGLTAARAAGLKCVAVLGTQTPDQLAQADQIIKSVEEVTPELVEALLN